MIDAETGLDTKIIVGRSEDTEAEFGSRADDMVTMLIVVDNEVISAVGYPTLNLALLAAREEGCELEVL